MNILGLFDGISVGQLACNRAGVNVDTYFSSEIDPAANIVTKHNFPKTISVGDITELKKGDLPHIDLVIGGSPCQGFSCSGKQLNFKDSRSKLLFEYVRLIKELDPQYYILENVAMGVKVMNAISTYMGTAPLLINSNRVTAQNRSRLYWTNFIVQQPEIVDINLIDILDCKDKIYPADVRGRRIQRNGVYNPDPPIVQCLEVRKNNRNKSNCLTTVQKDNVLTSLPPGRYPDAKDYKELFRYYTTKEYCRLQDIPVDYFPMHTSEHTIKRLVGNSFTTGVIAHILSNLNLKEI